MNDRRKTNEVTSPLAEPHGSLRGTPLPRVPTHAATSDHLAVDVWTYQVRRTDGHGPVIAEVFVTVDDAHPDDDKLRIEHWGLYPSAGWLTPSATQTEPPALQFTYMAGLYDSVESFRKHLRDTQGAIYIQTHCAQQDP